MTDWQEWHRQYEDPSSRLTRRLAIVRRRVGDALADPNASPARILSLCAGDGRDLLPVLAHAGRPVEAAALIELDPALAASARRTATELGLATVTVDIADAGDGTRVRDVGPVDLLLLCGIFGNISEADIRTTVAAVPALLSRGGTVIWTRGSFEPDLRPAIRRWVTDAGLDEVAFDSEPAGYGVGVARQRADPGAADAVPDRLFRFLR